MEIFFAAFFLTLAFSEPLVAPPAPNSISVPFPHPQTAADWYEWALIQIQEGRLDEAKKSLEQAIALDPQFIPAMIQIGFIELWQSHLVESYHFFSQILAISSCEPKALEGFREIGSRWSQIEERQPEEVVIYEKLNRCEPSNADTLFYLGRALARTHQWDEAERILKECLSLAPQYSDAEIQLAYLYLWQKRWDEAESLFAKYPTNSDAKMGLARAARHQGDRAKAKQHLQEILSEKPSHREARKEYATILYADMDYSEAESEFAWLVDDDPNPSEYWSHLFEIKSHTRYALWVETLYTDAKEDDPSLRAPVVKDYYFLNAVHLLIPLTNRCRFDLKQIYYHQRENDIFPPVGVNYSAYLSGGQLTANYFFAKNWRWDLFARTFYAWGNQNVRYPFRNTTRFEPGTALLYSSENHLFAFDIHAESFIIKNFARVDSRLLRTDYITASYIYRPSLKWKPEVEGAVIHVFIRDSLKNWQNTERAIARCGFPFFPKYVIAIYRFEHGHFDKLSQNYYSFKQQLRNVLGVRLHVPIAASVSWDTYYYHRWQTTYNLFQPIGNTVFVATKQYLVANWVTSALSVRYRDKMRLSLEGHYFHDTLPYRDWGLTGSFLWQF